MILLLPLMLLVPVLTVAVLVVGPLWLTVRLRRSGRGWLISLLPALIPSLTLASEAYPMWLVREIAKRPIQEPHEAVRNVYAYNGYAPEAVRLIAKFPSLQFTEAVIDPKWQADGSVYRWDRVPPGPVHFTGRRRVREASDCGPDEVSVPIGRGMGWGVGWYCTKWVHVPAIGASYEVGFRTFNYRVGPYAVFEREDCVFKRSNSRLRNRLITATVTGGIWWHLTEWLGHITGISNIANGNTIGPYGATTAAYLRSADPEAFLIQE